MPRISGRPHPPDGPTRPSASAPTRRVGCVVLPHLPWQAIVLRQPALRARPVAVLDARDRVIATSPRARQAGVRRGSRVTEACARLAELVILPRDAVAEAEISEAWLLAFDPITPVMESPQPGVALLELGSSDRYPGGEPALVHRLSLLAADWVAPVAIEGDEPPSDRPSDVIALSLDAAVGVADGPAVALLAARQAYRRRRPAVVIPPGGSCAFLAPLPVRWLPQVESQLPQLAALGIRTIGDFAALPRHGVALRFGATGVAAHRLAQGEDDRPLQPRSRPDVRAEVIELDGDAGLDALLFRLKAALDAITRNLLNEGRVASGLTLRLVADETELATLAVPFPTPALPGATAIEIVRLKLQRLGLAAAPTAMRLTVSVLDHNGARQGSLFDVGRDARRAGLLRAVARLTALSPSPADPLLVAAHVQAAILPEATAVLTPYVPPVTTDTAPATLPTTPLPLLPGLRLMTPPLPATFLGALPTAGPTVAISARLRFDQTTVTIQASEGPWRLATGWWAEETRELGATRDRAYYRMATTDGGLYLVFCDVRTDRWYVQGSYD